MAIIKCPECNKEISSTVSTCPHCGFCLSEDDRRIALEKAVKVSQDDDVGDLILGIIIGLFLGLIGLIIGLCLNNKQTKKGSVIGFLIHLVPLIILIVVYWSFIFAIFF